MSTKSSFFLFITFCWICTSYAQQHSDVYGRVKNVQATPLAGITVILGDQRASTDSLGGFVFRDVANGTKIVRLSGIGYREQEEIVQKVANKSLYLDITLSAADSQIAEVQVMGQSDTERAGKQAIRAIVVDTRAVAEQPVTLAELINRSPGVRIRQSGGLGNAVDVSVNGFQGRAVRYFKDGIPLNYLAGGYGIHNIPVNSLERVEVFKGVLPISLGADALGGAAMSNTASAAAASPSDPNTVPMPHAAASAAARSRSGSSSCTCSSPGAPSTPCSDGSASPTRPSGWVTRTSSTGRSQEHPSGATPG